MFNRLFLNSGMQGARAKGDRELRKEGGSAGLVSGTSEEVSLSSPPSQGPLRNVGVWVLGGNADRGEQKTTPSGKGGIGEHFHQVRAQRTARNR